MVSRIWFALALLPFVEELRAQGLKFSPGSIDSHSGSSVPWCAAFDYDTARHKFNEPESREPREWERLSPCVSNGTTEFCVFSDLHFAGRGTSILTTSARAEKIRQSKAFSGIFSRQDRPVGHALSPPYDVVEIPGKDMALIANRRIEAGERIMAATASIMVDRNLIKQRPQSVADFEVAAIDSLPHEHRAAYLNLSTHYPASEHAERVDRIVLTNAFDISLATLLDDVDEGLSEYRFKSVFPEVSRMNHDCRPNAGYHFDIDTFTHSVYAVKPIYPGDEITTSYINPVQPFKDRFGHLRDFWHFECSCNTCSQPENIIASSDARVRQIQFIQDQLENRGPDSMATTTMAELLISLYKQEELWLVIDQAYTYAAIEYSGVGEAWMAIKYARLAIQSGLRSSGKHDRQVKDNMELAENPWQHWSWMART
ncbi:N-lysine methyltransferase SMYD2 [Paramyrothecium foliicola]|nr:N-lysine methyltransferase SMYD2 [Paramyrothecium foliicola]